jgi:hypothetical protein
MYAKEMDRFVDENSIVRQIWSRADSVLFVFAGAAAEFALNKAVDWLYFTGRLPADPLGRLFSTMTYARFIIFSPLDEANAYVDQIANIHKTVEHNRGTKIPDWAYRDVLFMLIWYSIRAYEVLYRSLNPAEKDEVFDVFYRVGVRMGLHGLPTTYKEWQVMHREHLENDLVYSNFTTDLYQQYRKHLGWVRYMVLKKVQALIVPQRVNRMLNLGKPGILMPLLFCYKLGRYIKIDTLFIDNVLPAEYKVRIKKIRSTQV